MHLIADPLQERRPQDADGLLGGGVLSINVGSARRQGQHGTRHCRDMQPSCRGSWRLAPHMSMFVRFGKHAVQVTPRPCR